MTRQSICLLSAFAALSLCSCDCKSESSPATEEAQAPEAGVETPATVADKVAVKINGQDAIMRSEIDELVEQFVASNGARIPPDQIARVKRNIVRDMAKNLAIQFLLKAEADKAGVVVTDEDRTAAFARFGFADRAAAVEAFGMPEEKFDAMFDTNLAIEKLLSSQTNGIAAPTEDEIRARFDKIVAENPAAVEKPESVTASHILVKVDSKASDEEKAAAKEKIEAIRARALAGEDFAKLAQENSDCPSKANGGSLGSFGRGQMVKPFEDAAFSQEIGTVGEVVETQFGYHIIRVAERTEAGKIGFDEVKDELGFGMLRERERDAVAAFIDKVNEGAVIEYVGLPTGEIQVESDVVEIPADSSGAEPAAEEQPRELPEWAR
ncbi:MAG: peptidylprolyl isomerase [Kiritimatiellae bacterium]|nr:peptidylprolyl isomerase [Kiritimatiellia bacterium]